MMGHRHTVFALWAAAGAMLAASSTAVAAPMATKLQRVRAEATTIVVGTISVDAKGTPTVHVEYALRGTARRGPLVVKPSPDGHVFIDAKAPKRLVAFIDGSNQLRWIGQRIAGPSLERGVIRLHGFFNFNAHIVHPGILTLDQLKRYLGTGKLEQTFRGTLSFPDGKGGIKPSQQRITVRYDALARKVLAFAGPKMACLDHPSLSAMSWGVFRMHLHCRKRSRSLTLAGRFDGVDAKAGDVLVSLVPLRPHLYEREFWRYAADARALVVDRVLYLHVGGQRWRWRLGDGLRPPHGRRLRPDGGSVGTRTRGGKSVTYRRYRFGAGAKALIELDHVPRFPRWGSDNFSLVQLVDAGRITHCKIRYRGKVRPCHLSGVTF